MNFCGGSWYGVFVVNITGIDGSMAVEEDAAMFVCWIASRLKKHSGFEWDNRADIPDLLAKGKAKQSKSIACV
jgi:hypothetical protein